MQERLDPKIAELLASRLAGERVEDDAALDAWLADPANKERAALLAEVRKVRYTASVPGRMGAFAARIEKQLEKREYGFSSRGLRGLISADAEREISGFGVGNLQLKSWGRWAFGIGALSTAVLIAIAGVRYIPDIIIDTPVKAPIRTYTTAPGQRAHFTLADGSEVILNAGSRVSYPVNFGKASRAIHLDGEALFRVVGKQNTPFLVHSSGITTRVLGTSFTVRKYSTDLGLRVVVAEGKVSVSNAILSTGDEASVTSSGAAVSHNVDVADALAWTSGKLILKAARFESVIPELNRWYGLNVRVADQRLLKQTVTMTLETESPSQAIELLSSVLHARAERVGKTVTFHPDKSSY